MNVHCWCLSDLQGAYQYVITAHTEGAPDKLKVIHSVITRSVSQSPSVTGASLYSALFCVFMARVRNNLEQRVFICDCYVKKIHTNRAGEIFAVNFPTHVHLEIQFPN
jgi:hypothetical protein